MMNRKFSLKTVIVLVLIASALICILDLGIFYSLTGFGTARFKQVRRYAQLLSQIEHNYIGEFNAEEITDNALHAAGASLDSWSYYMTAEEYDTYKDRTANRYVGIGVTIRKNADNRNGGEILIVMGDSPAEKAGLKSGDIITAVDGQSVLGMDTDGISSLILREPGKKLTLTVDTDGVARDVELTCDYIFSSPIKYDLLVGNIGYIKIANFNDGASDGFKSAYADLLQQGAEKFIFDVRFDGGGYVNELSDMLDYLLPECEVFVEVNAKGKEKIERSDKNMQDYPAVVLMNDRSYSAAEYFAAVLSEYDYAQTVGVHTTGKSRSQITRRLADGGALHISSNEYVTPNRIKLYDVGGIAPDYEVEITEEEYTYGYYSALAKEDDTQLQKAIEVLNGGK